MNKIDLVAARFKDIQAKSTKSELVAVRLGVIENALVNTFCESLKISKSKLMRIALRHFTGYLDSLSPEEFKEELLKIKRFE